MIRPLIPHARRDARRPRVASLAASGLDLEELEGLAEGFLAEVGCEDPSIDAFELAELCRIPIEMGLGSQTYTRDDGTIVVGTGVVHGRIHMSICHELGHWLQRRAGMPDIEEGARYLAGCLLLPRRAFLRDLRTTSWSVPGMMALHVHASAQAIAVRTAQVRTAIATVVDAYGPRRPWRVCSPRAPLELISDMTQKERDLAALALEMDAEVRDGPVYAAPTGGTQVIVLLSA